MGIAGSMVNPDFFEDYLGMRVESIDMSEFVRRFNEGIYDVEEFEKGSGLDQGRIVRRDRTLIP